MMGAIVLFQSKVRESSIFRVVYACPRILCMELFSFGPMPFRNWHTLLSGMLRASLQLRTDCLLTYRKVNLSMNSFANRGRQAWKLPLLDAYVRVRLSTP